MTELGLAVTVLLASLTLTYVFCLRPMRRGSRPEPNPGEALDRDAEVTRLREEISALRADYAADRSRATDR